MLTDLAGLDAETRAAEIHPSSIVASGARIGHGVRIGPWCSIGPDVTIEDGVHLIANVIIDGHTHIGPGVVCFPFTTIGMAPQDLKYRGEPTRCTIGARTVIRENVTIHRGTATGSGVTRVGDDCLIMANSHVAHDCTLGNGVIIVNNVVMGGHVTIGDHARIMGAAALHQFVRIGRAALVGGVCGVEADVIPYGSVLGNRARLVGLHWIWLKRNGVQPDELHLLRRAFRALYPRAMDEESTAFSRRLASVRADYGSDPKVAEILAFIEAPSHRGLVRVAGGGAASIESDGV
ncbi:acyl-(acyl-carrier-protein)--UDP-N-acetylglucosamine O-acyltransferase [Gluconacetobacter diazotrophicus PA1 5]|nr:acyl-ACP--UDP-N-acetylglucosamine O-acyltransferase [Gluconacetobacter diazotrophicus]ACI50157.1 acyl-(acyl-carrier-protein)--UDP-N-acetylglucosamine O-acyltransferase [Gluconacetobacter diazotrophicus PA1 5]MBB2154923.1 acyl-ACP--UDP-N-acetylglucosamine O-acyltransferase [Gluconacetobacter diazotrophicus]TWB08087.1 acyl-[acyl-carrier-protein]--UDP-N-acetylglucosamine O-acyltransferase [Gluconacetobacter diazotrophicus]